MIRLLLLDLHYGKPIFNGHILLVVDFSEYLHRLWIDGYIPETEL